MNVLVITLLNVNILRNLLTFCQKFQVLAYPIIPNFNGTYNQHWNEIYEECIVYDILEVSQVIGNRTVLRISAHFQENVSCCSSLSELLQVNGRQLSTKEYRHRPFYKIFLIIVLQSFFWRLSNYNAPSVTYFLSSFISYL